MLIVSLFQILPAESGAEPSDSASPSSGPDPRARLVRGYPGLLTLDADPKLVRFADGTTLPFDDGRQKPTLEARLADPDLEDQLSLPYPAGEPSAAPALDCDPGRIRCEAFFRKVYGGTADEVRRKLVPVKWLPRHGGGTVMVTGVNGVDKHLAAVSAELDGLPSSMISFVADTAGSFNWRAIANTKRLSPHSFGIALDINTKRADYWEWQKTKGGSFTYRNRIPPEIVSIFERHGFIWGGKWYHYDTMHFEYRPELLP